VDFFAINSANKLRYDVEALRGKCVSSLKFSGQWSAISVQQSARRATFTGCDPLPIGIGFGFG